MGNDFTAARSCDQCNENFFETQGRNYRTRSEASSRVGGTPCPECPHCGFSISPVMDDGGNSSRLDEWIGIATRLGRDIAGSLGKNSSGIVSAVHHIEQLNLYSAWLRRIQTCMFSIVAILFAWTSFQITAAVYFMFSLHDRNHGGLINRIIVSCAMDFRSVVFFSLVGSFCYGVLLLASLYLQDVVRLREKSVRRCVGGIIASIVADFGDRYYLTKTINGLGDMWSTYSNILAILSPISVLFFSNYHQLLALQRSLFLSNHGFSFIKERFVGNRTRSCWNRIKNSWIFSVASHAEPYLWIAGFSGAIFTFYKVCFKRGKPRRTSVNRRRSQEHRNNVDDVDPVDPVEVPSVVLPGSPPFVGHNVVHRSLLQIRGKYTGTAFRCGNSIVTATHCLSKKDNQFGAWIFAPDEKKFYWAKHERTFRFSGTRIQGDGISVLSLPNCNWCISRTSAAVSVPPSREMQVGAYLSNNDPNAPDWAFSSGGATFNAKSNNISLWASIAPGSSGGPALHPNGCVVGVVHAENQMHNVAIAFSQDIVDFLAQRPKARSLPAQEVTQEVGEFLESCSEMSDSESILNEFQDGQLENNSDGRQAPKRKRTKKSENTTGDSKTGRDKQKKNARAKQKPGTVPPSMGKDDFESNPGIQVTQLEPIPSTSKEVV
nr:hypothetical protein [Leuven wasp-associated virus 7]